MGNCCCCCDCCQECCPYTDPHEYLYRLNNTQLSIIRRHCEAFKDVKYLVKKDLSFDLNGKQYVVKEGFVCDGVSSGCILSNLIGVDTAIKHDFLYATHPDTKSICDSILKPKYRRIVVGIFGNKAWQSSGQRGALIISHDETHQISLTICHTCDYNYVECGQKINLSADESHEFEDFFVAMRACNA